MKLPRDISGAEVVQALRRLGFLVIRQRGSHVRLSKDGVRVTVPLHSPIRIGTLQSILDQADITAEELLAEL